MYSVVAVLRVLEEGLNTGNGCCSVFGDSSWKLFNKARANGYLELIIDCLECGLLAIVENIT